MSTQTVNPVVYYTGNIWYKPGEIVTFSGHQLGEAVEKAASSAFVSRALPQETVEKLVCVRKKEWRDCQAAADRDGFEWRHSFDRL